ncbi:type II toxin-antitoxin system RelE/ParE family toxin [Microbacterium sp.]|nr:type II toxin-antitoxin system RelE/ParE family toxin [Microbacterium sp.]
MRPVLSALFCTFRSTGDYRVLYRIEDGILTVVVVHAGHRREVYR